MSAKWTAAAAALIAVAAATTGCGSSPGSAAATATASSSSYGSPVQAALSWFSAVNRKDKAAAIAHFAPAAADQMDWGNGDTSTWPTFSALRCKQVARSAAIASVTCTFSESQAPAVGNPDTFWNITLAWQPDKRWLITNYGQG